MKKLDGQVALVTGAGRGIGRAIALAFSHEGTKVAVTARSENELKQVVDQIEQAGGHAMSVAADMSNRDTPNQVVQQVKKQLGPIEILVPNAGVGSSASPKPVIEYDDDFWDLSLAVNLTAPYLLSKAVLGDMTAARRGRIIMMASINSKMPALHGAAYTATKHGLLGFTRALAMEVAMNGITVNAICPGPVRSAMNDMRMAYDADRLGRTMEEHEKHQTPLGRRLTPEEIAPMAVYLASDEATAVTGQSFIIDGGLTMTG